jgi:hypothetical protein
MVESARTRGTLSYSLYMGVHVLINRHPAEPPLERDIFPPYIGGQNGTPWCPAAASRDEARKAFDYASSTA